MKYSVIVNMNMEYVFDTKTAQEAYILSQNIELPKEYVEGSRDTVKILDENEKEYDFDTNNNELS